MGRSGDGKRPGVGGSREEARFARRFPVFLVAFVLVVIGLQILLRFDTVRRFPNESIRLEGVLVNDQAVCVMSEGGASVAVTDGDVVRLLSPDCEVNVLVSSASDNLRTPEVGTWAKGTGTVLVGVARTR